MNHKRCSRSKCRYDTFKDGNEKIILQGKTPKFAFCDQLRAFPLGHRKCK